jgi:putative spermidine/putrescine transport system permease protein
MRRGAGFIFLMGVTVLLMVFILLPLVVVVLGSFMNVSRLGLATDLWSGGHRALFDASAFSYVLQNYWDWALFSLELAIASVVICLLVAVPGAYVLARHPFPGAALLEQLVFLPLSLPGIALSMALLAAYGELRGGWLVFGGHLAYTIPFMVRVVMATLRSGDFARLETAAESLGANFRQRLWFVVLPGLRHAMTVGSLLVFAVSLGEFNVSFLLNSGRPQTFPAVLYDTYTNQSIQVSSAATTIFLLVVIPAVLGIQWLGGRTSLDVEQGA